MLAPAGVERKKLAQMPKKKHSNAKIAEQITTLKKLLKIRIALRAGKTNKLEIIIAPIKRIPITIVKAVKTAISALNLSTLMPDAFAKVSSKVTKKMRL